MPLLVVTSTQNPAGANWDDPFLKIYLSEINSMISHLESRGGLLEDRYRLAEALCDASRSLLYRIDRVTKDDCRLLCETFERAASAVTATGQELTGHKAGLISGFAKNLHKRVEMLKKLNEPASASAL